MKAITLLLLCFAAASLSAATVYVSGEKIAPEEAATKVARLLSGNLDEKIEAMNVLLAYSANVDSSPFLPQIREIAIHEAPYPEMDKLLVAAKGHGEFSVSALSSGQKEEIRRQNLQTLAICVLSVSNPGSMDQLLAKLAASDAPSLRLIPKAVSQYLERTARRTDDGADLATRSGERFSRSLRSIYDGRIPYTEKIGDILYKHYKNESLSFQDKAILLSVLKANKYEGVSEVIESLSKSENIEDQQLPAVITDLTKDR